MPKIFVSYSRKDQRFARRFVSILKRAYGDTSVFYDRDISGGTEWWSKILKEIGKADIFIYLLSSQSLTAPYCRAEMREAMRLGKRFLPVRIKANTRIDQAQDLARHIRQWLDLSSGLNTEALADLYREINTTLENPPIFQPQPRAEPTAEPEVKDKPNPLFDWLGDPRLQGIGVIVGILALLLAGYQVFWSNDDEDESPTPVTQEVATDQEKAFKLEEAGVSSNDEWTPYSEEINGVEMVLVPAGCFMMGSEDGNDDEKPVHEQCFDKPFWIDKTEVTRAMYRECVDEGVCTVTPDNDYSTRESQPINRVTWFQARDYCEWRGARLPTEREWEYAARGPDHLVYPWGNEFVSGNVIYRDNSDNKTAMVGSNSGGVSWVGALDMSGNVWEWVSTIYKNYPYRSNALWESNDNTHSFRVLGGGSFSNTSIHLRSSNRNGLIPTFDSDNSGFRCARDYE